MRHHARENHFIVSSDGVIRFTPAGLDWLGPYFAKAGIAIASIKTYEQYKEARRKSGPYFMERIADYLDTLPDTGDYILIKSILLDPPEVYEEKLRIHELKKYMKIV
jgi:hypothetical protein